MHIRLQRSHLRVVHSCVAFMVVAVESIQHQIKSISSSAITAMCVMDKDRIAVGTEDGAILVPLLSSDEE